MGGESTTISTSEPLISAVRIQQSTQGVPLPLITGRTRASGNLIWYGGFRAIPYTTSTTSGGKGGGEVTQTNTTYTYEAAIIMALGEGPLGVRGAWRGKKQLSLAEMGLSVQAGNNGQAEWSYLTTYYPNDARGYSQIAYVYSAAYQLSNNAEVENHSFEIDGPLQFSGSIPDSAPSAFMNYFLTNSQCGVGFPAAKMGSLTSYLQYCAANGLFISPALTEQQPAHAILSLLSRITNSALVWSEGLLKVIPYGDESVTANGYTYTPNTTPIYDLTDDDFIVRGTEDPVVIDRSSTADAYNHVQIECLNRNNQYNVEMVHARDLRDIEINGLRSMPPIKCWWIVVPDVGQKAAQLILNRNLYIRNIYKFFLGWKYARLEPMDLVTLTDVGLDLDKAPVRIISIEEDEDGKLAIVAEEFPLGIAGATLYPSQTGVGFAHDYNAAPGFVQPPLFFEPPVEKTDSGLEVWVAVTGNGLSGLTWGGCQVWASLDGSTYKQVGKVAGGARYGNIAVSAMGAGSGATARVKLAGGMPAQILSGTPSEAALLNPLCYVDGEWFSYAAATLLAEKEYNLTGLVRGGFGTADVSHAAGQNFAMVDDAIVKSGPLDLSLIGKTVYFKFPSFNVYGGGQQTLADVGAYSYTVTGNMAKMPPPSVPTFLVSAQADGTRQFTWDWASLTIPPDVKNGGGYKIRYKLGTGHVWENMEPAHRVGILTASPFESNQLSAGTYTFGIKVVDALGNESAAATYIEVTLPDPRLAGVIAGKFPRELGWPGIKTNCYVDVDKSLIAYGDTWDQYTASWDATPSWTQNPKSPITYEDTVIDLGSVVSFTPIVSLVVTGLATITESHSNDNVSYTAYAPTGSLISARYIKIKAVVTGSFPRIESMNILLDAKPRDEVGNDILASALTGAYRIGVGDIRLPKTKSYSSIVLVNIALQSVGPGWDWVLIDRDTAVGPRVQFYNGAGVLADPLFDFYIKGVP